MLRRYVKTFGSTFENLDEINKFLENIIYQEWNKKKDKFYFNNSDVIIKVNM